MSSDSRFLRIANCLISGSKNINQISIETGMTGDEVTDTLILGLESYLNQYWDIDFFNGNSNLRKKAAGNSGREGIIDSLRKEICPDTRVVLWCRFNDNGSRMELTEDERWALYDVLRECGGRFIRDLKDELFPCFKEFDGKYRCIKERRIIKQYTDLFNIDENLIMKLYSAIDGKYYMDIRLSDGNVVKSIFPVRLSPDEDLIRWSLEYIRNGEEAYIWLDEISEGLLTFREDITKRMQNNVKKAKEGMTEVTVRVYDEKNARDRAISFLSPKYIKMEKRETGYSDFTSKVLNIDNFKKWVMEMGPQAVVLEPVALRNELKKMIDEWLNNYLLGIQ